MEAKELMSSRLRQVVVLLSIALLATAASSHAAAVLEVDTPSWDFGKLYAGSQEEHIFTLRNAGDAPLVIDLVRPSCSACLGVVSGDRRIAPGATAELRVSYVAKQGAEGAASAYVTIQSNDPRNAFLRVTITGTVLPLGEQPVLVVDPSPVNFDLAFVGMPARAVLHLRNAGKQPLTITKVLASGAIRPGAGPGTLAAGEAGEMGLEILTDKARGLAQEWVKVQSNDPVHPDLLVPIYGYVAEKPAGQPMVGVIIVPVGNPLPLPGTGTSFNPRWELINGLSVPVQVTIPAADGKQERQTVLPGGKRQIELSEESEGIVVNLGPAMKR